VSDLFGLIRPLIRTRQIREFTDEPVSEADLAALADVARWSGSSSNSQPWRFIVIQDGATLRGIADAGMPQTRSLRTATAAIAIALPEEQGAAISHAFDEGRD
jgi:nitroreductase